MTKKKFFYTLSLILLLYLGAFLVLKAQEAKPLLHFVQVSDTHLNYSYVQDATRLLGSSEKLLEKTVEQINQIKDLDFVLATGDLVDIPQEKLVDKFIEITMSLKYPIYELLGNHDVGVNSKVDKKEFISKFREIENPISFVENMSYYSFSPSDKFTIICLDGTTEKVITSSGQIDDKQLEWLKNELEANKDKYVLIALHYPIIEPFESTDHFIVEPDRTKLSELIDGYTNVLGVFTGHYHAARLFKIKNKIHCSCPAIVQYPCAFREVTITQGEKGKYINLDFKWHVVNEPELREKSKNASQSWALAEGTKEDREQTAKLKIY